MKNLTSSKNSSLPPNSKRLPDISLESTENPFDFGAKKASKEVALPQNKLVGGHRKNKALDCKQYNILLEKKEANSSKLSNPDSNKKAVNSDKFGENLNKSKAGQNLEISNESWRDKVTQDSLSYFRSNKLEKTNESSISFEGLFSSFNHP